MRTLPHLLFLLPLLLLTACKPHPETLEGNATGLLTPPGPLVSTSCVDCHKEEVERWNRSHHAHALLDKSAIDVPHTEVVTGSFTSHISGSLVSQTGPNGFSFTGQVDAVPGYHPLQQLLVPFPGGRWQVFDPAYDPRSNEWFGVYGNQDRRPEEWGHWSRGGMNWNAQCAYCHTTHFEKNYNPDTDAYLSTWDEVGVGCSQCHTQLEAGTTQDDGCTVERETDMTHSLHMEHCGSCHARREELTGTMPPGDLFDDHYRLALPDRLNLYYPDGQILDEDYVFTSFRMSRMHHQGVTCMDCHDPHSGEFVFSWEDNMLCMQCHNTPGRNGATPIDPVAHSYHKEGSTGNQCVNCHMPHTTYMERDPRRDHGFHIPDPQLTLELGIPNACNRCHEDKSADWAAESVNKWWGSTNANFNATARTRARLLHRGYRGDPSVVNALIDQAKKEEIPLWRATFTSVAGQLSSDPHVVRELRKMLKDENPMVRDAAIRGLNTHPDRATWLPPLLNDTSRTVRTQTQVALAGSAFLTKEARQELENWVSHISDQPAGALRQAELALAEGRNDDAMVWGTRAIEKDSPSGRNLLMRGHLAYRAGKFEEAEQDFLRAIEMEPNDPQAHYTLALLYAETGKNEHVIETLERATQIDPTFDRAWYNLGLAYAGAEQLDKAIAALLQAEAASDDFSDYAYARATIHLRKQDTAAAQEALLKVLSLNQNHRPSLQLLQRLQQPPRARP